MKSEKITLAHGSGGQDSRGLIASLILKYFNSPALARLEDAARLKIKSKEIIFTTDSFVVNPLFFSGGSIGDLAVCGTVNDISVSGGTPKYLSLSFIIEEGFSLKKLERILRDISARAKEAEVQIVTGDTKVVEKGAAEGVFINTSGLGELLPGANISSVNIKDGDVCLVSGPLGGHGLTVMNERHSLGVKGLKSDTAPLNKITGALIKKFGRDIKVMRDITRGGLAATLTELAQSSRISVEINEDSVPFSPAVKAAAKLLGVDPLFAACEGRFLVFVKKGIEKEVLKEIRKFKYGAGAAAVGRAKKDKEHAVFLLNSPGVRRKIKEQPGPLLPRIC